MKMFNSGQAISGSRQLAITTSSITRSLQRLSTGKRVNSPADGQSDFTTVVNLDAQVRGLNQANLNINAAQGLLQTADAGLSSQIDLVNRMRELATEGSSDTLSATQRDAISKELAALMDEFQRIVRDTEFGGVKLLDGTFSTKKLQIGAETDDQLDLTLSSFQAGSSFLRTVGSGTFKTVATGYSAVGSAGDMIFADFNNDGIQDFATADAVGQISIRTGKGDGTFNAAKTQAAGTAVAQMYAADVNGDRIQDIVVADNTSAGSGTVDVFLGNGDGSLKARVTYAGVTTGLSISARALAFGDFDKDGDTDIAVGTTSLQIGYLSNKGDGTFNALVTTTTTYTSDNIASGDFNGDGNIDVILSSNTTATGSTQVMSNDGSGNFTALTGADMSALTSVTSIAVGDYDKDGDQDLLIAGSASIQYWANDGTGVVANAATISIAAQVYEIAVGDFNGDDILDFVGRSSTAYYMYTGNGGSSFTAAGTASITGMVNGLAIADLNKDGAVDFGVTISSSATVGYVGVVLSNAKQIAAVGDVNASTATKSQRLVSILDTTLDKLVKERNGLGRVMERLEKASDFNSGQVESLTTAKSTIEDADISIETSELVKNQILQQAQVAMLSQSNSNAQLVLGLLLGR